MYVFLVWAEKNGLWVLFVVASSRWFWRASMVCGFAWIVCVHWSQLRGDSVELPAICVFRPRLGEWYMSLWTLLFPVGNGVFQAVTKSL